MNYVYCIFLWAALLIQILDLIFPAGEQANKQANLRMDPSPLMLECAPDEDDTLISCCNCFV